MGTYMYITEEESNHYAELESEQFVSKFHEMDPQTEDILKSGDKLKNGMIVLIENAGFRIDVENFANPASPADLYTARMMNRWCTVSDVEIVPRELYHAHGYVSFVGVYPDGTKRTRKHTLPNGWYVKKSSIPQDNEKGTLFGDEDDYNYGAHLERTETSFTDPETLIVRTIQ